ncbi:MAG: hypothetical protein ABW194_01725, partial [Novosphingobium sp.]
AANALLFAIVRDFAAAHTGGPAARHTRESIRTVTAPLLAGLIAIRDTMIAANQDGMLQALETAITPTRLPASVPEPD